MRCKKQYVILALGYFAHWYDVLANVPADLFAFQEFEGDLRDFRLKLDDTDRSLGAIFCQALDNASGLEHTFKVWSSNRSFLHE